MEQIGQSFIDSVCKFPYNEKDFMWRNKYVIND